MALTWSLPVEDQIALLYQESRCERATV
jgi:hypothetical protein